jgi:hypothetical protein
MIGIPASTLLSWALAALFAGTGLTHLAAPRWLRTTYQRWEYPASFPLVAALFDTLAAVLLAAPDLRGWGIGLAELIAFLSVIAIFTNERKVYAVPAIVLMIGLVPAALSIPHQDRFAHDLADSTQMASEK